MMAIELLDKNDYWQAKIDWSPLRKWHRHTEVGVDLSSDTISEYGIYRFEGRYKKNTLKRLLYIGIAYEQEFDIRLHQGYHQAKLKYCKAHEIHVSVGTINLTNTKHTRNRYEEIESILIYFCTPSKNIKKKALCPDCYFKIQNSGHRGILPRRILYPVAEITY